MKACTRCGETKPLSDFYKMISSKDGHRPDCITCHLKSKKDYAISHPTESSIKIMANTLLHRLENSHLQKNQCYEGIECHIGETRSDIQDFLKKNFLKQIENLIAEGKVPSIDRIDSAKHYTLDNIQIIDVLENSQKGVENAIKATSKEIVAFSKDGQELGFESISAAARHFGIKRDTIYRHLDKGTFANVGYGFRTPVR